MRSKKFITLVVALVMVISATMPVSAYRFADYGYGPIIVPDAETEKWWVEHVSELHERGIWNAFTYGIDYAGDFSDGLLPVTLSSGNDYVDKNGNLANLNQGRYELMYAFSDGMAAVFPKVDTGYVYNGIGYIDTTGNQIIPTSDEWLSLDIDDGMNYVGYFKDGKAVVLRERLNEKTTQGRFIYGDYFRGLYYAYIDKNGNYLTDWTFTDSWDEVFKLPLYNNVGVWIGHSYSADLSNVDIEAWNGEKADEQPEAPQAPAFQWHAPELPPYNQEAPSLFGSTAKVTGFYLGDLDFGVAKVTITNPNDVTDAGVIAAVFVNTDHSSNNRAGCFFVPYELGAGESREYSIEMRGIINQGMFVRDCVHPYAAQLEGAVDASIITFENDADMHDFYNTIPYEQNWQPTSLVSDFQHLCDGPAGNSWLEMIGMPRIAPRIVTTGYPQSDGGYIAGIDANHDYCAR